MGGILAMPQFLNYMGTPSDFRQGLMTAALIAGEVVGSLLVGFIFADRFGRRTTIFVSIALYLGGQALLVAAQNQAMFIVGRVINGLGAGPWFQTISLYVSSSLLTIDAPLTDMCVVTRLRSRLLTFGVESLQPSIQALPLVLLWLTGFNTGLWASQATEHGDCALDCNLFQVS